MLASVYKAFNISILIVRLVVPFFILGSVFQYFGYIENIAFLFEPITSFLSLPSSVAIAFAAAFFFNMYAGIAVAKKNRFFNSSTLDHALGFGYFGCVDCRSQYPSRNISAHC